MNIGVILAGGSGVRFGGTVPKQYQKIKGKDVISYVIDAFVNSAKINHTIVVSHPDYVNYIQKTYSITAIEGGDDRNITVYNALNYIRTNYKECTNVVFADSARPCLKPKHLDEICTILEEHDALITVAKITDSLSHDNGTLVDRSKYFLVQTPEAFRLSTLSNFKKHSDATAIIQQSSCSNVYFYKNIIYNFKITYPEDLVIVEALLEAKK
jgi:2-C-methyl-D-erythritol 4-phosphate cytidylyltransferase